MRLWHILFLVAGLAVVMSLARHPVYRVLLIVLATGAGEFVFGLFGVMALFQTVGAIGEARSIREHAEALAATSVVLCLTTAVMDVWLFAGLWLVKTFV
jgi:hypothetical protein